MKLILISFILIMNFSAIASNHLFFQDQLQDKTIIKSEKQIISFISKFTKKNNLKINTKNLVFDEKLESLISTHYTYKQVLNGLDIKDSTISISIDNKTNTVVKVYTTLSSEDSVLSDKMSAKRSSIPFMSDSQAMKIAWNKLNADGELLSEPRVKLIVKKGRNFPMVYEVELNTSSPFGYWIVEVNARNGEVLSIKDQTLSRKRRGESLDKRLSANREGVSLASALNKYKSSQKEKSNKNSNQLISTADGEAKLFDPNPVTTLERDDLQDNSSGVEFSRAYFFGTLKGITIKNGIYHLEGKHIILADFESPSVAPSTTIDGKWHHERKDIKFNDAMTYYHLDKNIRYIESLGYSGAKSIFKKPMLVDANGVSGADNSHYIPSKRRLAFGHGCVDDNEDSDVILHELGHAIHSHINKRWGGGHTGAIGEGFGDYWAASYSTSRKGGMEFHPEWVFKWDGHNDCWDGRKLDATSIKYRHTSSYSAHRRISGGVTDELWSTPIFQAFLELRNRGVDRSDLDKIVLESQFGLGSGLKMRDLARSVVKSAEALFPNEDYAEVYTKHFKKQNILK